LPWAVGVVAPNLPSGTVKHWNPQIRPLPENARLYASVDEALRDGPWDWVLAHNAHDLLDFREIRLPKVFLVHGTLSGRILQDRSTIDRSQYVKNLQTLLQVSGSRVVYISELKERDWGMPGTVIRSAVDCSAYGGYRGDVRGILQVCNRLRERGAMMGWAVHRAVCRDLPHFVLGDNPNLPRSRMANDWEDLKEHLRSYRVYLFTPAYPYEDGYNLSLLEAMATGMPVATLEHRTSPVRDGIEGIVASKADELRSRVLDLLDNPEKATELGQGARRKVEQEFPVSDFKRSWESFVSRLS
jgi:glycosyltransferase involved in cell wall biosynthesis